MEGVFHFILTTSFYASIVGIVILLLKVLLKNKLSPKWHYLIWSVLLLKLLIPFGPESTVSFFNVLPRVEPQNITQSMTLIEQHSTALPVETDKNEITYEVPVQQQVNADKAPFDIKAILPYLWAASTFFMLLWLFLTYYSLFRKLHKGSSIQDERILAILETCKQRLGVNRTVTLVLQDVIEAPALFGAIKPKILLTPAVINLNEKQLEYILLHELAHYKRRDILTNYLLLAFQAIHWFNPVLWYCFKRIRQDMEVATDERALLTLAQTDHKDYGKTLLALLEELSTPKLAPRLLGMADNKKDMERRIRMIKMVDFFKHKRNHTIAIGVICIVILGGLFLTNGKSTEDNLNDSDINSTALATYDAASLFKHKSLYIGDASNAGDLVGKLPFNNYRNGMSLATESEPYGITVNYDFTGKDIDTDRMSSIFQDHACIMFALIKNLDEITFNTLGTDDPQPYEYSRAELQKVFDTDLWSYSRNSSTFTKFINDLSFKVLICPGSYTPAMSSTQGIHLSAASPLPVGKVIYSTENGVFLSWDGKASEGFTTIEMPYGASVCWSAFNQDGQIYEGESNIITVTLLNIEGKPLSEKSLTILYDGGFYNVQPSPGVELDGSVLSAERKPTNIEDAVRNALRDKGDGYLHDECKTEGHLILDTVEKDGIITVYTIASTGWFGFENGIFTKVSGSGAIPSVMIFSKNDKGEYDLLEYKLPEDGEGYGDSLKELFPKKLHNKVFYADKLYPELMKMQEEQATRYLQSIGRKAKVTAEHVDKKLADINVQASNKLTAEYTKYDELLNNCPYWLGTREQIEDGIRYTYQKSQSKTSDGYDLIAFSKATEDGIIVEERYYKIVGSDPQLVDAPK
ncbi:MAG: M56 family metallopeptidase [Bacillota bacterium]|nr:M56 family metallopeptidase [Bacillota bacterium]